MRPFFASLFAAILLCLSTGASAQERQRFAYAVICEDPALAQVLRTGIETRLRAADVYISEKFPVAKLFVYANRDANDRKNPEGVSIAIAHVSNVQTALLGLAYVKRNEEMPEALRAMLGEEGFLKHMNVAHVDTPSEAQLKEVLDKAVASFLQKYRPAP